MQLKSQANFTDQMDYERYFRSMVRQFLERIFPQFRYAYNNPETFSGLMVNLLNAEEYLSNLVDQDRIVEIELLLMDGCAGIVQGKSIRLFLKIIDGEIRLPLYYGLTKDEIGQRIHKTSYANE